MKLIKELRRRLSWLLLSLFGFMLLLCLYIIKPFKSIKLLILRHERFAHLAGNTDLFLRRLQLKGRENGVLYIGVSGKPANQQLLKMFQRKFFIIQNSLAHKILFLSTQQRHAEQVLCSSWLRKSGFCERLPFWDNEYYEFNNTEPNLSFTISEEEEGKKLLRKMGIDDNSWFVCFHSRDSVYFSNQWNELYSSAKDWSYHDYRNADIRNYLEAAKYIASLGGFAVRIGYGVGEELPDINNPRIIDYASNYRTDFGDIYLLA
ncbi:MAG: TIGR04372 family glycosyltransferase, partial [bacterium]